MKLGFKRDFAVQVRHEEGAQAVKSEAVFYRGIFSLTLNQVIRILFIPSFPRTPQTWPPTILPGVDEVQRMAAISGKGIGNGYVSKSPHDERAIRYYLQAHRYVQETGNKYWQVPFAMT